MVVRILEKYHMPMHSQKIRMLKGLDLLYHNMYTQEKRFLIELEDLLAKC